MGRRYYCLVQQQGSKYESLTLVKLSIYFFQNFRNILKRKPLVRHFQILVLHAATQKVKKIRTIVIDRYWFILFSFYQDLNEQKHITSITTSRAYSLSSCLKIIISIFSFFIDTFVVKNAFHNSSQETAEENCIYLSTTNPSLCNCVSQT